MRTRIGWLAAAAAVTAVGLAAFSLSRAQTTPQNPVAAAQPPAPVPPKASPLAAPAERDLTKFTPQQKQWYFMAGSGAAWLKRASRADGRFDYVTAPALRLRTPGEPYLRQAAAAVTLARAAAYFGDEHAAALATQSLLTLLLDTTADNPKVPQIRHTAAPTLTVNRLAAAGLLARAVGELPHPQADLLDQAEQLCNYLRRQQRPDGAFSSADQAGDPQQAGDDDGHAAEALHGLLRAHRHRPAAWKLDMARKAFAYYHPRWRANKSPVTAARFSAAYTEAFVLTKERPFADAVFEMNDWLCTLQYQQPDPMRPLWHGGFMSFADGKAQPTAPDIGTALYAGSLAEACRAARHAGDALRHPRYREALERGLQFLTTLQFTETNAWHFTPQYRPQVVGAFHAGHQDGNLRLDYTQQAVQALVQYLVYEGEVTLKG